LEVEFQVRNWRLIASDTFTCALGLGEHGFDLIELIATEGVSTGVEQAIASMSDPALRSAALDVIEQTEAKRQFLVQPVTCCKSGGGDCKLD
jgi:hypothetical protein